MSSQLFFVSDENPNDVTGGGGCMCSPERQIDCKPPYIVAPGNDLENIASPHVVVCKACADRMSALLMDPIEIPREQGYKAGPNSRPTNQVTPSI